MEMNNSMMKNAQNNLKTTLKERFIQNADAAVRMNSLPAPKKNNYTIALIMQR